MYERDYAKRLNSAPLRPNHAPPQTKAKARIQETRDVRLLYVAMFVMCVHLHLIEVDLRRRLIKVLSVMGFR